MKKIKTFIFGQRAIAIDSSQCKGIHHTVNTEQISKNEWFAEFRVGMMFDRRIIELN